MKGVVGGTSSDKPRNAARVKKGWLANAFLVG